MGVSSKLAISAIVFTLTSTAYAFEKVLPDACGSDKVKFDVDTFQDRPAPGAPEDGKALIVFIETIPTRVSLTNPTARFGVDGSWVGADHGNSYFTLSVTPGLHHLCSNWQGHNEVGVLALTAEAGKTYYFEVKVNVATRGRTQIVGVGAGASTVSTHSKIDFSSELLSEDEGKYRIKASEFATSKPAH